MVITFPSGEYMQVNVLFYSGARRFTEVHPQIQSVGLINSFENLFRASR